MSIPEYDAWLGDPSRENLANVVESLKPTINSEVQRYTGPKPLLRSRAKSLAIKAIQTYDPAKGANLRSWVVTQLQPLARYGQQMRPMHASEVAIRQAAEVNRRREEMSDDLGRDPTDAELADETGISMRRIRNIRKQVKPTVFEGTLTEAKGEEGPSMPGVVESSSMDTAQQMVYDSLTTRDKAIYDWKTGKHGKPALSNQLIAKRLGVTPALVSQRSRQIAEQIMDLNSRGV
jgi:DNA-directed RNA polymerase specialized sigma subunit